RPSGSCATRASPSLARRMQARLTRIPSRSKFRACWCVIGRATSSRVACARHFDEGRARVRILHVNTLDVGGGAEGVARGLQRALKDHGHGSMLAVGRKLTDDPNIVQIPNEQFRNPWARTWRAAVGLADRTPPDQPVSRLKSLVLNIAEPARRRAIKQGREDFDFPGTRRLLELGPERPSIVHAHNLHGGYFDLRELPELSHAVPFVLTLHDAWLLSGHCAHSFGCERWEIGCGQCPDLTIYPAVPRDATATNWTVKERIFTASRLHVATPSNWLMDKVRRS